MSQNARRFHPSERPAPKTGTKRKAKSTRKQRAQKHGTHVNKYAGAEK
jgi:hypothetical protein